jgi:hypothetical protein
VYHVAFRRWVHSDETLTDLGELAASKVDVFLDGAARLVQGSGECSDEPG